MDTFNNCKFLFTKIDLFEPTKKFCLILKKNYKRKFILKIKIWDKLINLSRIIDVITFNSFGKSLLIIIKKV